MAIYHLHAKVITRSKGQSAVASAAYRRAEKLFDEQEQRTWNYSAKEHVVHCDLAIPENAPAWVKALSENHVGEPRKAIETLWNKVEQTELRSDAQLAREFEFALPIELNQAQCIALAKEYIEDQFAMRGMIADWAVHWEKNNPHVHVMTTMRELTAEGFGNKIRSWNSKELLVEWRTKWADYANFHLRQHGIEVKIDHRSYAEQGIALIPTLHQGKAVRDMESRGIPTTISAQNNAICLQNLHNISDNPDILLDKLISQKENFSSLDIGGELGRYIRDKDSITPETIAQLLESIEKHESVFTEKDIVRAVESYTHHADTFAQVLTHVMASSELISLGAGEDGRDRFTTKKMFAIENDIQNRADELKAKGHIPISSRKINQAIASQERASGNTLTQEQRVAVEHILKPTSISCLVGRAGTGKSFSLGAARAAWEANNQRVIGIALSGVAADGLSNDAGIEGRTIESFLYALETEALFLHSSDVVVMDEAGMTDSVSMKAVITAVKNANAKLVLVGDHAQLQPVGPGAAFRALVERLGFAEIYTVYRQKELWQREATVLFSAGQVAPALEAYHQKGAIRFGENHESVCQQLVNDWISHYETHKGDLSDYLVIAHQNQDVLTLNTQLRHERIERGQLSPGYQVETERGAINIAQTDRILFLQNDRSLGLKNGRFATVKSVRFSESGKVIDFIAVLDGKEKQEVLINPKRYANFTYGYAATGHKTQGATFNHTFVYAGGWMWDRCLTYVAMTRHRLTCTLYANQEIHGDLASLKKNLSRHGIKDSVLDFPLAFALRRSIDISALVSRLPEHLSQKLSEYKDRIVARFENLQSHGGLSSKNYSLPQEEAEKYARDFMRREEARDVAQYKDLNSKMGATYTQLNDTLKDMGFNKISYAPEDMAVISQMPVYHEFKETVKVLNRQAFVLMSAPEKYTRAISLQQIDTIKLAAQAESHACYARVEAYLNSCRAQNCATRDANALVLMNGIKAHFGAIKELNVEIKSMREHALNALKSTLFSTLSPAQQKAFGVVERYYVLTNEIGAFYGKAKDNSQGSVSVDFTSEKSMEIKRLVMERNRLAHHIISGGSLYQPALDFMQIGQARAHFTHDNLNDEKRLSAQKRLQKMHDYRISHQRFERVEQYLLSPEGYAKRALAFAIAQEAKLHHGALMHLSSDPKGAWKTIRHDANVFERERFLWKLQPIERAKYQLVDAYLEAKRVYGRAWRAVLECKKANDIPDEKRLVQLLGDANAFGRKKDALAQQIVNHLPYYREAIQHYGVEEVLLQKEAAKARCYELVKEYASKEAGIPRFTLASILANNPKAYHGAVLECQLHWRDIYKEVRNYERYVTFKTISLEEKRFLRLMSRYHDANRLAGKLFSKTKAREPRSDDDINQRIAHHFAKRDYLAWELVTAAAQIGEGYLESQADELRFKKDKLEQQATKHTQKLTRVAEYQAMHEIAIKTIAQGCQLIRESAPEMAKQKIEKGLELMTLSMAAQNKHRLHSIDMKFALAHYGVSTTQLDLHKKVFAAFKSALPQLAATHRITLVPVEVKTTAVKETTVSLSSPAARIDVAALRALLNEQAEVVATHYLGNPSLRQGKQWRYGAKGSLSVTLQGTKRGCWYDFQAGEGGDMLSLIQRSLGTADFKMVLKEALHFAGGESHFRQSGVPTYHNSVSAEDEKKQKIAKAREIVAQTQPILGTLAERYLREHRGITVPTLGDNLRYHPRLYHPLTRQHYPALVVVSRNKEERICAVQSIYLDPITAKKAAIESPKITRGVLSEEFSAVLVQKGEGKIVALAEGPETALSIASAKPEWAVYSTLGIANFARAPLPSDIQKVLICADNDGDNTASQKMLDKATDALSQKGLDVWLVKPKEVKADFNDVLLKQGVLGVNDALANPTLYRKGIRNDAILDTVEKEIKALSAKETIQQLQEKARRQGGVDTLSEKEREVLLESFRRQFQQENPTLAAKAKAEMQPSSHNRQDTLMESKMQEKIMRFKAMAEKAETLVGKPMHKMQKERLAEYAYQLSQNPSVMGHLRKQDEKAAKQIEQLSRAYQQELSLGRRY
jgi:ATP-dependent exoDNAse (exonuclease V) alpha subunit